MTRTAFNLPKPARLAESGFAPETQDALLALEEAMFHWHRRVLKGELTGRLLAEMGAELEPGLFQGLTAVVRIETGVGRTAPAQPTVGLVAEEMAIDPSRASRITSALIARGYLAREAAQEDGRKSVLRLTDKGRGLLVEMRERKWLAFVRLFADWDAAEIADFSRLFRRYVDAVSEPEG